MNIEKILTYILYSEREKRDYKKFKDEYNNLKSKERLEIESIYTKLKSEYEFKKVKLTLFIAGTILGLLKNVISKFYVFLKKISSFMMIDTNNKDIGVVVLIVFSISLFFMLLIIIYFFYSYILNLQKLYRKLLMIAGIRRECDKNE